MDHAREDLDQHGVIGEVVQGWLDFYGISERESWEKFYDQQPEDGSLDKGAK